jgi:uncharacterized protein (DUF885 family)
MTSLCHSYTCSRKLSSKFLIFPNSSETKNYEMKAMFLTLIAFALLSHNLSAEKIVSRSTIELNKLLTAFYEDQLKLSPLYATFVGENRYNDLLPADFTDSYRAKLKDNNNHYLTALLNISRAGLPHNDKLSYDIFRWQLEMSIEGLSQIDNRMPFNQLDGIPYLIAQLGSGDVVQPFKTVTDYNNWISRATAFSAWADSAIAYFRKGMAEGIVLPKTLVIKMIPQIDNIIKADATETVFYGPIKNMPNDFNDSVKKQLTNAYVNLINENLMLTYKKLRGFLQDEYLPEARTTSGLSSIPAGNTLYDFNVRLNTTIRKPAEELYNTGILEVKRIRVEMEKVKNTVGFKGDLKAFFKYMSTDRKFFPYKTPEEVLIAYRSIHQKIKSAVEKMFLQVPKTPFEIRQTEDFRAASATPEYLAGLADGSRPGIFYVPIVDPAKTSFAAESLFAHEAIPGHHYQIMLQFENESIPKFRRYGGFSAYIEGWGLYSESLGKELGLYTDHYQYMSALGDEMHRALRLVVDPGLHIKKWTREQAIQYMLDNEQITEGEAIVEIERYMAIPGQALSYKIGSLKIQDLRKKYTKLLGSTFSLAAFHDNILKDGAMPLEILEQKMDEWVKQERN